MASVEVVIHCLSGQVEAATRAIETCGTVVAKYLNEIQAVMPVTSLASLADEESIEYIELPVYAEGAW